MKAKKANKKLTKKPNKKIIKTDDLPKLTFGEAIRKISGGKKSN
jgi:hypothetical protein